MSDTVTLWVLRDIGPEWEIERQASVADWVEVGRQLGAEIAQRSGPAGDYLVIRLPVESPTPKDDQ